MTDAQQVVREPQEFHGMPGHDCDRMTCASDCCRITREEVLARMKRANEGFGPIQDLTDAIDLLEGNR